jgi:hypothetical protein
MGRSHSKIEKPQIQITNHNLTLSPRQRLKHKKFGFLRRRKTKLESVKIPRNSNSMISEIEKDSEFEMKIHMQEQLAFNSDIWVLNQMMMSIQFFANYER